MEPEQLRQLLANYERDPQGLVEALHAHILPAAVETLNREVNIRQMAKLPTERLPQNERNLTDARTRLGVLLEYALATVINREWQEKLGGEYTLAFVVANRYPDLVSRDRNYNPGVRIEVKAIEAISEEKSANLDVLMRDTRAAGDVLCVLVWEWREIVENGVNIEYPHIYRVFAFSVRTIAKIRDTAWLYDTSRFKGIDVGGPVVGSGNGLKEEEHNMGKLLRIGGEGDFDDPALAAYRDDPDARRYQEFRTSTITLGIQTIARRAFSRFGMRFSEDHIDRFTFQPGETQLVAIGSNDGAKLAIFGGIAPRKKTSKTILGSLDRERDADAYVLVLGEKFSWFLSRYDGEKVEKLTDTNKKPERAMRKLEEYLPVRGETPADTIG